MNLFGGIYTETGLKKFSKNKGRTPVSGSALKRNWLFYSSFLITKTPNPPLNIFLRFFHTAAVKRQPFFHLCPGAEAADIVLASPEAAAFMGAEGTYGLSRKIKMLQEGEDRHRHGSPVVGIPQINRIVPFYSKTINYCT